MLSTNSKTRNKSNAKRRNARQAQQRRTTARELFGDELAHAHDLEHPRREPAPTTAVIRIIGTGGTGHKGAEVAKLFATGAISSVRRGGRDAAGPIKEDVGLTTQRGGFLDYRGPGGCPDHMEGAKGDMPTQTARRGAQIGAYTGNRPNLPPRPAGRPQGKPETGSIIKLTR